MQQLISGNRYEGKEDFAVVLQPFLQNFFIPQIGVCHEHPGQMSLNKRPFASVNTLIPPSGGRS